jgi:hypothetical protein
MKSISLLLLCLILPLSLCETYDWKCEAQSTFGEITCNTTYGFFKDTKVSLGLTKCEIDQTFPVPQSLTCMTKTNYQYARLHCPTVLSSSGITENCKLYTIDKSKTQEGVGTYNWDRASVVMEYQPNTHYDKCTTLSREEGIMTAWQYFINCVGKKGDADYEVNCFNYEKYYDTEVWCIKLDLKEMDASKLTPVKAFY